MPTSPGAPPAARIHSDDVLRVRASGFGRRFIAALVDGGLLVSFSMVVTLITALVLGAPMPHAREIGPDLLVAGHVP